MKHTHAYWAIAVFVVALVVFPLVGEAAELVRDANNPASWTFEVAGRAAATMRQEQGGLRVDITSLGDQNWHVQMFQAGKQVREGAVCTLRFTAKASARRQILINCQTDGSPWRQVISTYPNVELTTEWQPYTVELPFKDVKKAQLRVPIFILGDATGTVWLKDVSVMDGRSAAEPARPARSTPSAPSVPSAPPVQPAVAPAGWGGLLADPMEASNWKLEKRDGAQATLASEEDMLRIDVETPGAEARQVQIYQEPQSLAAGRTYFLTINLRSTTPRKLVVTGQQGSSSESLLPATELNVGPEWKQYKLRFTLKRFTAGQTRLPVLQMGDTAGTVFIRWMALTEAGEGAGGGW